MKKFLLVIIALTIISFLRANPLPSTSVALSEIYFDTNGKWVIELQYSDARQDIYPIDSIWIKSASGISKVKRFNIVGSDGLIVIRNDSLMSNLVINPKGDFVEISYFLHSYFHKRTNDPVIFGNFLNASLNSPRTGQSIACAPFYFGYYGLYGIDISPTIGAMNDTIGMLGTLKGHIYDKNDQLLSVTSGHFSNGESNIEFYPKPDGSYSIRFYSRKYHISQLIYKKSNTWSSFNIEPFDFSLVPDSVVVIDIHILDTLNVGIKEIVRNPKSLFKIYPNPIRELSFSYEIEIPVKSSNCYVEIVDMNGQKIERYSVIENKGKIDLPSGIKNGIYTLLLFANNRKYSSSKLLIAR